MAGGAYVCVYVCLCGCVCPCTAFFNANDSNAVDLYHTRLNKSQITAAQLPADEGAGAKKRHSDAGELRYSLRGLEKNAPWVGFLLKQSHMFAIVCFCLFVFWGAHNHTRIDSPIHPPSQLRTIHLVTSDGMELPLWLNVSHPRLHVVRHSEIFENPGLWCGRFVLVFVVCSLFFFSNDPHLAIWIFFPSPSLLVWTSTHTQNTFQHFPPIQLNL